MDEICPGSSAQIMSRHSGCRDIGVPISEMASSRGCDEGFRVWGLGSRVPISEMASSRGCDEGFRVWGLESRVPISEMASSRGCDEGFGV
jgi:hypothetical protein